MGNHAFLHAAAQYSSIDLTDGPVDGGEMDILSLGVNW
jgi:hypothetical protein